MRAAVAAACSLFLASTIAACGDDDNAPAGASGLDGGARDDARVEPVDATPPAVDGGTLTIEDLPDTPCVPRGGTQKDVYAADATAFRPLGLVAVGPRRAMQTDDGFVMMDADGSNASAALVASSFSVTSIGGTGTTLLALGPDSAGLTLQRFDANGAPSGEKVLVSTTSSGFGSGGGEGKALVAWTDANRLRAIAFGDQGAALADPFTFRNGIVETEGGAFSIAHAGGDEFGVAYAGQYAGIHRLVFTRVSTTKRLDTSYTLLVGTEPLRLVQLARVGDGFAVLVERRLAKSTEVLLLLLDAEGRFKGTSKRLANVRRAFGLASSGGELAVLAWRGGPSDGDELGTDAIELRPLDAAGAALGPWVCLDEPFTVATVDVGAAILGEDAGYTVLMRTPKRAVSMVRTDRRGTGGT